ncbi:putative ATP-dependent helicase YprA [Prunus yedoensis var. nudiflora]|uniref:Putative ATP-dependent helicase YprA n=1 Tax=Prunus yedoensis var. nudiflora TaxID=2094558 RepID=A0A314XRI8_PRUYE|nr:putative ATP-dependent helicase YprA [Prunus yedoensis var. nudiflora]
MAENERQIQGGKLGLQSKIGSLNIKPDEFLVLVPFSKKEPNNKQSQRSDQSKASLNGSDKSSTISNFADSAWSDMMQDLSSLRENSSNQTPMEPIVGSFNLGDRTEVTNETSTCCSSGAKREKGLDSDDIMLDILRCSRRSKNVLDEHNFTRFVEVLASVSCLSDPYNGDCMLWRRVHLRRHGFGTGLPKSSGSSCLCPPWLKIIMKAFAFLNTFSAFIQSRQERTTSILLEQALGHLLKFGVELGLKDIKNLSVISPKVVRFVNKNAEETSSGNAIVIINCSTEDNCKHGCKQMDVPIIVSVLKIRESSFRSNLWKAIEWLLFKTGNEISRDFSLEGLLISVKECDTAARGNEAKQSRITPASSNNFDRKHSATSRTRRCHGTDSLLPVEMVEHLRKGIGAKGQIVHVEDIGARRPVYVEVPHELSENMRSALHSIGITQLYSHQAESIQASLSGKNVVVATMTSSGKSLCYNLPVLEVLSQSSSSCALYLFPTKALAQDQLRALLAMTKGFDDSLNIGVYDGDTTQEERTWLRHNSRLLITNPDMLHVSILPHHRRFARILENLRFVVIDEAHIYKGAFGCHTAFILRRLRRLCSHVYGSDPSFVFSTATSANPHNHCMELASLTTLELIQNDGSPAARKLFILWNPFVDQETVVKNPNNIMKMVNLLMKVPTSKVQARFWMFHAFLLKWYSMDYAALLSANHASFVNLCCAIRLNDEMNKYYCARREILQQTAPHLVDSICAYRAGYIAQNRRRIESDFFDGKLCGIAATNALELGIDVGHIDVTLHLGFPGSISSLWQQAGRAGRRDRPSLAVYVAFEGPLDQYFMKYPKKLFGSPIECCHVDAKNQQVLAQQLVCAAHEHPLGLSYDEKFFGSGLDSAIVSLKNRGYLSCDSSCNSSAKFWNYIGHEKMPSHSVSIRSIETERYKVIDQQKKEILEEIEESRAFFQVYEGAVYMNQGKTYLVTSLDLSHKIALCYVADLKYYTKSRDSTDIHVIGSKFAYRPQLSNIQFSRTTAQADPCKVTTTWLGYCRVSRGSNQIIETVDHVLPKYSYESQAVWVPVPQSVKEAVIMKDLDFRAGLHAASHVVLNVVPLRIICNLSDLAPECINLHTRYYPERILLYDQHPGGSGVSVQVQPIFMELLIAALELLTSCRCSEHGGCPNCLQSFACKEYNEGLHKEAAIMIFKGVLDAEKL